MKNTRLLSVLLIGMISPNLLAQPSERTGKEKMKIFATWTGHWQGEGTIQMGPGPLKKSSMDEYLEFKLDGIVLLMEGIGKGVEPETKGTTVHHALGVLSFDQSTNQYILNSYLKDGRSTQAWFNILDAYKYQWGFNVPTGKIKYTIVLDPKKNTWNEIGEFSRDDGKTWMKFFEMNLKKV